MHRDLNSGNKTEVISLTQFVVNEGIKYGVKTPLYEKIANALV
jgi:ketopantoate reductase